MHIKAYKIKVTAKILTTCLIYIIFSGMAHAGSEKSAWTNLVGEKLSSKPEFEFVKNNPALPNVLIYGDSISMGYTPRVRTKLRGKANVYRIYCNGGGIARVIPVMTKMHKQMAEYWKFKWDVIHFNVGLHDLKYLDEKGTYDTKKGKQVHSTDDYKKGLKEIIEFFKNIAPNAQIIFATTTPVPGNSTGRIAGDASKYNEAALEVLKSYPEIIVNDLYSLTKPHQSQWWKRPGNVHYNESGTTAQGDMVAGTILTAFEQKKKAEQKSSAPEIK